MPDKKKILERAFEYANGHVLEKTSCPGLGTISNGWCDVWALAVKRNARFVEVRQSQGHWFVMYEGVAYDSDTTALSDRPGDWRVSIVGSRANDNWEMKIWGPNGFERSYTLVGSAGEHQPVVIGNVLLKLLPAKMP
jgi:hypothetical protein